MSSFSHHLSKVLYISSDFIPLNMYFVDIFSFLFLPVFSFGLYGFLSGISHFLKQLICIYQMLKSIFFSLKSFTIFRKLRFTQ